MVTIITALSGIKTGLDLLKGAREMLKKEKPDVATISTHLSEIQDSLYQAREALGDAQEENRSLRERLDHHKELEADKYWEADGGFYRRKSEMEKGLFIPYCPTCWHAAENTIPMARHGVREGVYKCPLHDPTYQTSQYTPPRPSFRSI